MAETDAWWQKIQSPLAVRDEAKFIGNFKIPSDRQLSRAQDRKVDFVVAGTQKGGTTALDAYLRLNPEICMPHKMKELHFFETDRLFGSGEPDYRLYHAFFKPKDRHRLLGEATPDYMYYEAVPRRLHAYNSDIRIVLTLRNPIERAFSHWNMFRLLGWESLSFGEALCNEEERTRRARNEGMPSRFSYADRGYYVEQIRRLRRYFPSHQMLIIKQEALHDEPDATLRSIWEFLGVEPVALVEPIEKLVGHYSESIDDTDHGYLRELYEPEIKALERLLGWDCSDWLA